MLDPTNLPPRPDTPPRPPWNLRSYLLGAATGVVVTAVVVAAGAALGVGDADGGKRPAAAPPSASSPAPKAAQETAKEEGFNEDPQPADFLLTLKTTSKQCFGSAGCNLTVEPDLTYVGLLPVDPDKTYSITYEIRGGDDGSAIETAELTERTSLTYQPVSLSTATSKTKVTAKVTAVQITG